MRTLSVLAVAALAGGLLLTPAAMQQANAAHGFGGGGFGGGGHFAGGMGGGHFGGGPHFVGGNFAGGRFGGAMGGPRFAAGHGSPSWNGGRPAWHGANWHGHDHDHFVHDHFHDRFHNRFVAVGIGGWWPGYYGYGYGGCSWLYDQALYTGSPYWWNRYNACVNYY